MLRLYKVQFNLPAISIVDPNIPKPSPVPVLNANMLTYRKIAEYTAAWINPYITDIRRKSILFCNKNKMYKFKLKTLEITYLKRAYKK